MFKRLFKLSSIVLTTTLIFMNIPVSAEGDTTVEGDTTRFVTGNAHASQIEIAGYNARTKDLYVNVTFTATTLANTTLDYYINIFEIDNSTSTNIGSQGSHSAPESISYYLAPTTGQNIAQHKITLNKSLPSNYNTVVTIKTIN